MKVFKLETRLGYVLLSLAINSVAIIPVASNFAQGAEWDQYGGQGGQQYTEYDQIRPDNLDRLEPAWRFRTGDLNADFERKQYSFQANPVFWDGLLYISTSANWVIAVEAHSGVERWRFDPGLPKDIGYSESASRGVTLWHGTATTCPDRVFIGTLIGGVHALDARTGAPCTDFGDNGRVDMREGVGNPDQNLGDYGITSPPAVIGDQIIVGSAIGDNRGVQLERGVVRALDARTGAVNWYWDPIPRSPDEPEFASWEGDSALITGAANVWPPISVDAALNLVYVSTGSPSPDFYGGERLGDNNYANSLVALEADTGRVSWHQQLVHHDIWDYDIPSQPTLTNIQTATGVREAVIVVTKTGMLYAFDRRNGEPVYEITEKPVLASAVPGERAAPTQPFSSVPALSSQRAITENDAFGILWFDKRACRKIIRNMQSGGIFTPPSLQGTIMNPGYAGGSNWGGVAVDPTRQIAIANVNQIPALVRLIPRNDLEALRSSGELDGWDISMQRGTPYYMARRVFLSALGLPCVKPPWGELVAVDLKTATILWNVPLGTIRDVAPAIVPNFKWGVPGMGGAMVTASGLVVIGAAAEEVLRIFDIETGEELWKHDMPASPLATPMSYTIEGEQYIAIVAGGHDALGLPRGDYLVSFKLKTTEDN